MIGDHGNRFIDLHDLPHTPDRARRCLIERLRLAAEYGRDCDRGDGHSRPFAIDAELRAAHDLVRCVEPSGTRADEREVLRLF
jgi:hypothetical protein